MPRRQAPTQAVIVRALKAASIAGVKVSRFEVDPVSGRITVVSEEAAPAVEATPLARWRAGHGAR